MDPSKIGFLSIRVVFHFHGYGRKAKLNLLPFAKGKGFHPLILEGERGALRWGISGPDGYVDSCRI